MNLKLQLGPRVRCPNEHKPALGASTIVDLAGIDPWLWIVNDKYWPRPSKRGIKLHPNCTVPTNFHMPRASNGDEPSIERPLKMSIRANAEQLVRPAWLV